MDSTQAIDRPVGAEESFEPESQAFLAKADEADWLRLFEHCVSIPFRAGDEIIRQGDGGQSLFIVAEGELESIILNEDEPHTVQLALMPAQSVFGEQALPGLMPLHLLAQRGKHRHVHQAHRQSSHRVASVRQILPPPWLIKR